MRLFEYIEQGGPIMYLLVLLNIVGWALMLSKLYFLSLELKSTDDTSANLRDDLKGLTNSNDASSIIELTKQIVSTHVTKAEKGLNTIKIIATISPLLGLLGTVLGVLTAFHVMSQTGLNNPSNFAQGISMALITTVGGMIVAIPHYVGHNYLLGMLDKLENVLEKKTLSKVL